ncbi:MAG: aminomethyl-transferring glycine dehydrogenase subunit GcvPB, partial [Holophagaceae bacterium]
RPLHLKRKDFGVLPSCSEPEIIRHFTRLSLWNYGMDQGMYPLGSCTMKHNPRLNEVTSALPGFSESHPMASDEHLQGNLELIFTLQEWLKEVTGLHAVTLQPSAGAAGELTGVLLIRAYHLAHGHHKKFILVPD